MSLTSSQIEAIERFAQRKYENLHHTHAIAHANRTVELARYLANKEGADSTVCRLGALLHQYHPENSGTVNDFLESLGVEEKIRKNLVACVECVEPETITEKCPLEAKVVFDADKLQTLGPFGLIREVVYRVETMEIDFLRAAQQSRNLQKEIRTKMQTEAGKELAALACKGMSEFFDSFESWKNLDFLL